MKEKTRDYVRIFGVMLIVMVAVPLAYQVCIRLWPPDTKPRKTLTQFFDEAESARCMKLLVKPVVNWSETEARLEPEIYAWLKEQGNDILPWEWTEEARRKDPKGYAKCWRRVWEERKEHCENLFEHHQKEAGRLEQELQLLATVYDHRTNQIVRLRALAATNAYPCQVSLEHIEKGWLWGWNRNVEVVECSDAPAIIAATNSICSKEEALAQDEGKRVLAMSASVSSSKEKSALYEQLCAICDKNRRLVDDEPLQDDALKKSLIENLKSER